MKHVALRCSGLRVLRLASLFAGCTLLACGGSEEEVVLPDGGATGSAGETGSGRQASSGGGASEVTGGSSGSSGETSPTAGTGGTSSTGGTGGTSSGGTGGTSSTGGNGSELPADHACQKGASGKIVDARDDNVYCTVKIGSQTWLAENLRYVPSTGNWWCPEEKASRCSEYGVLYRWTTAVGLGDEYLKKDAPLSGKVRGVCMDGWHVPSRNEFKALLDFAGGGNPGFVGENAAKHLKSDTKDWWAVKNYPATDKYGFHALPAGEINCNAGGSCSDDVFSHVAYFWTSTELDEDSAVAVSLRATQDHAILFEGSEAQSSATRRSHGRSIRCIKD